MPVVPARPFRAPGRRGSVSRVNDFAPVSRNECRVDDLAAAIEASTEVEAESAAEIVDGIPVYAAATLVDADRQRLGPELARVLARGAGVLVIRGAVESGVVQAATEVFRAIIDEQRALGTAAGDHYAAPGANDRIWNALEKLAVRAPSVFIDYYGGEPLHVVTDAWFGPGAKYSSQVNVVNPGGAAQEPHRDYPMGFMTQDQAERYPRHVHALAPHLTLQAGIAHSDMPLETGPTMVLPGSQRYELGYLAWRLEPMREYFAQHHVQPELRLGDAVFFNPAVFHGAGANRTDDVHRMANLLQISSPFGVTLEAVDRDRMARALYPDLLDRGPSGHVERAVAVAAEPTPFPFNLDRDQPIGGLAPPAMAELVTDAVAAGLPPEELAKALDGYAERRRTH